MRLRDREAPKRLVAFVAGAAAFLYLDYQLCRWSLEYLGPDAPPPASMTWPELGALVVLFFAGVILSVSAFLAVVSVLFLPFVAAGMAWEWLVDGFAIDRMEGRRGR